ncbi:MAG TPA: HK97 family phage prohead protease [Vicinamibacterales bacterium]|jgi:HK97 family phage prohead protease|nr:HK97 family phage prohead protease [Vicinamibacterales bacterium]
MDRAYALLTVKTLDAKTRTFSGMASTPELDRLGDSVDPAGVIFRNPLPLLLHHDQQQPIGTVVLTRTAQGIAFEASLPFIEEPGRLKDRVDEAWQSIKARVITGVSIGFRLIENAIEHLRTGGRRLLRTEIFELSLVTIPANASATILMVKSLAQHGLETAYMAATLPRLSDITRDQTREVQSLDFCRYLSCLVNWRGVAGSAAELYLHRFNDSYSAGTIRKSMQDNLSLEMKAAVAAGTTTDATWAKPLVGIQQLTAGFLAVAHSQSLLGRIPDLQLIPFNAKVPYQTADATFQWVSENSMTPTSKLAFSDGIILPATKGLGIVVLTAELVKLSGAGMEKAMRRVLISGLNAWLDKQFLDPAVAAVAGKNPASITNGITPIATTGNLVNDVKTLIGQFFTASPGSNAPVLLANGGNAAAIRGQVPGFGLEVIATEAALTNVVMIDPDRVFYGDDGIEVQHSEQAMLEMNDAPTTPPTAATVLVSLWQQNLAGFRVTRFVSWGAAPNAVKVLATV